MKLNNHTRELRRLLIDSRGLLELTFLFFYATILSSVAIDFFRKKAMRNRDKRYIIIEIHQKEGCIHEIVVGKKQG